MRLTYPFVTCGTAAGEAAGQAWAAAASGAGGTSPDDYDAAEEAADNHPRSGKPLIQELNDINIALRSIARNAFLIVTFVFIILFIWG